MEREDFSFGTAGLYVHVPFCASHCHYCNFVITTASGEPAHRRFLEALAIEAGYFAPQVIQKRFQTLYFGGGTPSQLSADEFSRLTRFLRGQFQWAPAVEVTLEANPDDVDAERTKAWKDAGVQRISLGAQSFNNATLVHANRRHTASQIADAVRRLRDTGFKSINLDLILSMPGESLSDARRSMDLLLALDPEHVSLYELVVEPKTVFGKWYASSRSGESSSRSYPPLPSEDQQAEILTTARSLLKQAGYRHYELLNYAKPGHESKHNLLYWANRDYLGLGPGAYSYLDGRRFRLADSVEAYYSKIEGRNWRLCEEEMLSSARREVESMVLALRTDEGAARERFAELLERKSPEIHSLVERGLLASDARGIRLTERGQLFAETVFSEMV